MSQLFASGGQSIGVSAHISPSSEHSGLISFRMDWLDLLAVQGALKSLLQHHSSKASILAAPVSKEGLVDIYPMAQSDFCKAQLELKALPN